MNIDIEKIEERLGILIFGGSHFIIKSSLLVNRRKE